MDKKNIYYTREILNITEGGISRDKAFYEYFENKEIWEILYLKTNRNVFIKIFQMYKEIKRLLKYKNKKIFMHQNNIFKIFPVKIFSNILFLKIFKLILNKISCENKLILEINDLVYEQAIDLELLTFKEQKRVERFQKELLNIKNATYIFAAEEMRKYTIKKYNLEKSKTYTCINGAIGLDIFYKIEKLEEITEIKCIYAGTLNKGRQIEKMINLFENKSIGAKLILIGIDGEWLNKKKYKNVIYMGAYPEQEALNIVAQCDLGLIPYDEKRLYYNICYPTKNSFYICGGIPILSTHLKETIKQFKDYNFIYTEKIEEWDNIISKLTREKINKAKIEINKYKNKFFWTYLINKLMEEIDKGEKIEKNRNIDISLSK